MAVGIRYDLDNLGWVQFEELTQALLKADLGLGIEAWGGHSDRGRDAYATFSLPFPVRGVPSEGPFLFQAKFVTGANAAGARPFPLLKKAILAEAKHIAARIRKGDWTPPRHYIVMTNSPVSSNQRLLIEDTLSPLLDGCRVYTLAGPDICQLLENQRSLVRAHPEILGLRDLDVFLSELVNAECLNRSRACIEEARSLSQVFVATEAYHRALTVLRKHHFVVLDGPPEMGKTAIARILGLTQIAQFEWEAIECRGTSDFFKSYDGERSQVFLADDAFGRTEYDPEMGRIWEKDLTKVLLRLNKNHWLILTTRKHILARALHEMDLVDRAAKFPKPGEVVVTAQDLATIEKALILFKHSKATLTRPHHKDAVKASALRVIKNPYFTPERIRRLVSEVLPEISEPNNDEESDRISEIVAQTIRNPTDRMRKAFSKLPERHKWLIISFLQTESSPLDSWLNDYMRFLPGATAESFRAALEDVEGTFLRRAVPLRSESQDTYDWIHPSYRDLVIDELSRDVNGDLQCRFLQGTNATGLRLAVSEAGGAEGKRVFPLMGTAGAWSSFRQRCLELVKSEPDSKLLALFRLVRDAIRRLPKETNEYEALIATAKEICHCCLARWQEEIQLLDEDLLDAYVKLSEAAQLDPVIPDLVPTWEHAGAELRKAIRIPSELEGSDIEKWETLAKLVDDYLPSLNEGYPFEDSMLEMREELIEALREVVSEERDLDSKSEHEVEAQRLRELAEATEAIPTWTSVRRLPFDKVAEELEAKAARHDDLAEALNDEEEDSPTDVPIRNGQDDEIASIFQDL